MTKSTAGNAPLQLYPPQIKGQTSPVEPKSLADAGVSLAVHDLVPDGNGAHVDVDPPPKGQMQARDEMKLWIEGETAVLYSTIIVDPDAVTALRIPKGRLHPDKVNNLFYTIERNSGNEGTSSILRVLYNRIRPGLKDRYDSPGGHSELKLDLSELIRNGVGADFVSAQVCVSYPYCRAYDRITLKCNGELMHVNVAANQAPQPPNPGSETPITICFTVTRAYLELAKREDQKLIFSYTVTDQLGNGPDTDAPWSPVQSVDEDLDGTRLPIPILLERLEDFPGDDASIIDLEKLADNPLLVVVLTTDNRFVVGYNVIATYTATNTGQPDDVVETDRGKVEADKFGVKQTLFLEVLNDKVFAGSNVTVTYELRKPDDDPVGSSNTATATVVGSRIVLKPPKIKEAPNDTSLDPLNAQNALTAVIDYDGMLVGDKIIVKWTGAPGTLPGGSHTTDPWPVTRIGPQEIPLAVSVIAFNLDKSITLDYSVTRGTQEPKDSQIRTLAVLPIAQSHLPKPLITQASEAGEGSELDVSQLTTNATLRANSYPHIALRQYVWLNAKGTLKGGGVYSKTFWQPPSSYVSATWINQGFYAHSGFPLTDLQSLEDGSDLELEFKAGFGGTQIENEAVTFAVRTYVVKATPALEIDTSPMVLDGPHFYPAPAPHIPPFDTTAYLHDNAHRTREARGGNPPYQYSSSDLNVASVDPKTGHVVSTGIGTARITARDERGATNSYEVSCKNVYELVFNSLHRTHAESMAWLTSIGAQPFPHEFTNDPTAQAASFSFQKVSSSPYHYWYTAKTSNPSRPQAATCFTWGHAQWVTPPYSKGINFANETVDVYSPYQTIGFKARRF